MTLLLSDMKRQECLSSLQSIDSAKLCVATETATNGNVGTMTLPPPSKTCRVGISYWSVARAETEPKSPDYHPQNGLTDTIDRPRLDSSLSEGEQVNVFSVEEHIDEEERSNLSKSVRVPIQKYPAVFRWTGNGEEVCIAGSFNSWRSKIPLVKSQGEFYTVVDVPEGTHQYKYFIDGDWKCHPNEPKVDNGLGTQNNILTINHTDCDIYHVLQSDSLGAIAVDRTASPPGGYSQYIPAKDSGIGFHRLGPPLLPPHLLDTVLNKDVPLHCEPMMVPEPNHVVLNHLYTLSIKGGIMVLSTTHRYRKKYITTLLYKPIT